MGKYAKGRRIAIRRMEMLLCVVLFLHFCSNRHLQNVLSVAKHKRLGKKKVGALLNVCILH